jgi:hypothetical protein
MKKNLLIILALLMGCTHDYHGRQPDFHKEGADASQEYDDFKIYSMHQYRTTVGQENGIATKSLLPMIKDVSPKANRIYRKMEIHRTVQTGLTAVMWITVGVFLLSQPDAPGGYALVMAALVGGHAIYMDGKYQDVKNQYNQDLKHRLDHQKVVPHLGYSWNY